MDPRNSISVWKPQGFKNGSWRLEAQGTQSVAIANQISSLWCQGLTKTCSSNCLESTSFVSTKRWQDSQELLNDVYCISPGAQCTLRKTYSAYLDKADSSLNVRSSHQVTSNHKGCRSANEWTNTATKHYQTPIYEMHHSPLWYIQCMYNRYRCLQQRCLSTTVKFVFFWLPCSQKKN